MLNIKTDIKFSSQHKNNIKVNANSLLYTTFGSTIRGMMKITQIENKHIKAKELQRNFS